MPRGRLLALISEVILDLVQDGQMSQTALQAAQAEAIAAKRAAREHAAQVATLRSELDKLNRQLEQTCTLRLQPHDASDSQVLCSDAGIADTKLCCCCCC